MAGWLGWRAGRPVARWLAGWAGLLAELAGCLARWLGWLAGWAAWLGWLVGCLAAELVGWLASWLVGWLAWLAKPTDLAGSLAGLGWLAGRLAGWLD